MTRLHCSIVETPSRSVVCTCGAAAAACQLPNSHMTSKPHLSRRPALLRPPFQRPPRPPSCSVRSRRLSTHCAAQARAESSRLDGAAASICPPGIQQRLQAGLGRLTGAAAATALAAAMALSPLVQPPPAAATDAGKVGACLLQNCPRQLASCLSDPNCVQNLICINKCEGGPDVQGCQVRCGDLYENPVVQSFNACALSQKGCVAPKEDGESLYPVPPDSALDTSFDVNKFQGRWYISAGLNKLFDTFPCQEHYFGVLPNGKLAGRINWRVPFQDNKSDDDDFLERTAVQVFEQQQNPAVWFNHGNAYLRYSDDWYILLAKPDMVLVYYKGNNDAWHGYGGATVYSRDRKLPPKYIPEIKEALAKVNINWDDFTLTDNSCPPRKKPLTAVEKIGRSFEAGVDEGAKQEGRTPLEESVKSLGKGLTVLRRNLDQELTDEQRAEEKETEEAGKFLEKIVRENQPRTAFRW